MSIVELFFGWFTTPIKGFRDTIDELILERKVNNES